MGDTQDVVGRSSSGETERRLHTAGNVVGLVEGYVGAGFGSLDLDEVGIATFAGQNFDLVVEPEREPEYVEAGADVRRCRWDTDFGL